MMTKRNAAGLLLVCCLLLVGLFYFHSPQVILAALCLGALAGTVTVTYAYPVQGTVVPTVVQMKPLSMVTAAVNWGADSDTVALITHNMQLGNIVLPNGSLVAETSCLFPLVGWYYQTGGSTNATIGNGSIVSSSVFQITKASGSSSAGTVNVFVLRPSTVMR